MKKLILLCVSAILAMGAYAQQAMTKAEIQKALKPLFEKLQALPDTEEAEKEAQTLMVNFVKTNKNDAGATVLASYLSSMLDQREFMAIVNSSKYWKENERVKEAIHVMEKKADTAEGKKYTDFSAEHNGKVTKLSDYVGRGKYVLVDFWASWCGPCKMEIPNLIAVYNKYKGSKFTVLGVATWDKPEETEKAIASLGINYPQMLNAQRAGSDAYGIQGIPEIILFGPDGTILKRGLRGAEIEKAVAEYLK